MCRVKRIGTVIFMVLNAVLHGMMYSAQEQVQECIESDFITNDLLLKDGGTCNITTSVTFTLSGSTTVTTTYLPPAFSNVTVMDQLTTDTLCTNLLAAGNETIQNELNADYYSNLSNYEVLRASRSIFNTFGNALTITAADGTNNDQFGFSVALSGDASTLAVGSPGANGSAGRVYIYERQQNSWVLVQEINNPDAVNFQVFGNSIAISYDGMVITVCAPGLAGSTPGSVFLYVYNPFTQLWALQQQFIQRTIDVFSGSPLIVSCLSATAQYLVIAHYDNSLGTTPAASTADIYVRTELCSTSGLWELQFLQGGGIPSNVYTSNFCALSADGTVMALAQVNPLVGNTLIFVVRSGTTWSLVQTVPLALFSNTSVALSADGTYAVVSCRNGSTNAVKFFARRGNLWVQEAQLTTPGNSQSKPVAISADGTMVYLVNTIAPTILLYCRTPDNGWTLYETVSVPNTFVFGQNVSCSADGSIVAVGQASANSSTGQVTVFYPTASFIPAKTSVGGTLCVEGSSTSGPLSLTGNLHVQGTVTTGTTVTACSTVPSDEQIKTDIQPLAAHDADRVLHDLQPVNFSWADDTLHAREPQPQTGFVAQDIEKLFADWVITIPDQSTDHQQNGVMSDETVKMVELPHEMLAYLVRKIQRLYEKDAEQQECIAQITV